MTLQGTKNLENWCKLVTDGKVNVVNMSTSWRNGLGFCAIIHHFRPDLIDIDNLDPEDVYGNNELAFRVAEAHLGIPSLLDPADMLECAVPDRLSILTYLSQFYHAFHSSNLKPKKSGSQVSSESSTPSKSISSSTSTSTLLRSRAKETCQFCEKPVFILERINVAGHLLHRTCFKCRRCGTQLSVVNFYETEAGQFCCDLCPDEEKNHVEVTTANKKIVQDWSAMTEEKTIVTEEDKSQKNDNVNNNNNNNNGGDDDDDDVSNINNNDNNVDNEAAKDESTDAQNDKTVDVVHSGKTDDERIMYNGIMEQSVENPEPRSDVESDDDDDDIDEKNESEKSEKENKILQECAVEDITTKLTITTVAEDEKCDTDINSEASSVPDIVTSAETTKEETHNDNDEKEDFEEYPDDLNPFGDDQELESKNNGAKIVSSNPFGGSDDDDDDAVKSDPNNVAVSPKGTPLVGPPKPPRASLNPFGSDFEDDEDDEDEKMTRLATRPPPTSPSLSCASGSSSRKKRQAPPPPKQRPIPSPRTSLKTSPAPVAELRRHAPPRPPPPSAVPPKEQKERENLNRRSQQMLEASASETKPANLEIEMTKSDESVKPFSQDIVLSQLPPNKASEGVWKKKKGPAPPRPIPPKSQVKKMPRKAVNQELHDIEVKQQELERQGVKLEKTIRELCEKSDSERLEKGLDNNDRESLGPEAEDLIMQLFELVNEKNDLYRRQTELMYMKREHRLEEEQADIEYQIRVLMSKAETLRTDDEKLKEEQLIARLMDIVAQRNEIVDCLEMDRLRELEEDESIEVHMGEFAAVRPPEGEDKSKKKKKEKERKKKKKDKFHDDDKDIDTSENTGATPKASPKKSPLAAAAAAEKDLAKKMKKKILSTLKPVSMSKRTT